MPEPIDPKEADRAKRFERHAAGLAAAVPKRRLTDEEIRALVRPLFFFMSDNGVAKFTITHKGSNQVTIDFVYPSAVDATIPDTRTTDPQPPSLLPPHQQQNDETN